MTCHVTDERGARNLTARQEQNLRVGSGPIHYLAQVCFFPPESLKPSQIKKATENDQAPLTLRILGWSPRKRGLHNHSTQRDMTHYKMVHSVGEGKLQSKFSIVFFCGSLDSQFPTKALKVDSGMVESDSG